MDTKSKAQARRAYEAACELLRLLDGLQKSLSGRAEDYAGYLLITDVNQAVFGRKSTEDVLGKLSAVAAMGEKNG